MKLSPGVVLDQWYNRHQREKRDQVRHWRRLFLVGNDPSCQSHSICLLFFPCRVERLRSVREARKVMPNNRMDCGCAERYGVERAITHHSGAVLFVAFADTQNGREKVRQTLPPKGARPKLFALFASRTSMYFIYYSKVRPTTPHDLLAESILATGRQKEYIYAYICVWRPKFCIPVGYGVNGKEPNGR